VFKNKNKTMEAIFEKYFSFILNSIVNDVHAYNHWWMWVPMLIPAIFYTAFLVLKFFILMLPITIPFGIVARIFKGAFGPSVIYVNPPKKKEDEQS
jgi:ABC-type dipeptide/oligopeptide/nickel transport system permease component